MSAETLNLFEEPAPNSSIRAHAVSSPAHAASADAARLSVKIGDAGAGAEARAFDRSSSPADDAVGRVLDGKYRIERKIGEGAMGVVLAATHISLDEPVALKFMRPEVQSMEGTLERFAKEAKIAARIRSEHVAKVLDVGEVEPLGPYIVMEYLEGESLAEVLDARLGDGQGPLPAERVVEYLLQACEALAAAHAIGVVHRDVKPDNLFITRHAGLETVKLLDFGISKSALAGRAPAAAVGASTTAFVMGTPLYMSPEQLRSLPDIDCRTDVWSMGAVMYELLSGGPPFPAASVPEICAAILDVEPAPLPPSCPPALGAVVMRCLEKDRERRFQTVAELASALVPFAPGEARAYASRSSCILRASALQLEPVGTGAPWPVARSGARSPRFQSSALVAAATVLALSALGVASTVSKMSDSASTAPSPASVRAPAPVALVEAPAAATARSTPATPAPASELGTSQAPGAGAAAELAATTAPPQRPGGREVAPKPKVARSVLRSPAAPASSSRPVKGATPRAEPALDDLQRVARPRLVEPRSRVRLVERVEAPARPGLVGVDAATLKPSTGGLRQGEGQ